MKRNKKKSADPECINVFWDIPDYWNELSYERKLEHYWRFDCMDGKRVICITDDNEPKTPHNIRKP